MRGINKLSATMIRSATERGLYGDGAGLYMQVSAFGTKAWVLRYQRNGTARTMGLGAVNTSSVAAARQSLSGARERAQAAQEIILAGGDPIEARLAERDAKRKSDAESITFKDAAAKYIAAHEAGWQNAKHRQQWRNTLRDYAYPTLGKRPVAAIDDVLINDAVAPIWNDAHPTASRVKNRIKSVIAWIKGGMPLPAQRRNGNGESHHPALPFEQTPEFMAELREREGIAARALEFLILTSTRTGDVIGGDRDDKPPMMWGHVDFDHKVWTIPSTKTDAEHRVPLSDRALEILKAMPRLKGNDCVFPGDAENGSLSNMSMAAVIRRMNKDRVKRGLPRYIDPKQRGRDVVPHGFRSTFKDWARERTNHPHAVVEAAMAHTLKDKVERAYARGDLLPKRVPLMRDWARYCTQAPRAATVAPIARAAQ